MKEMIAVVDYGMGNLRSVAKALEHVAPDAEVRVTSVPADLAKAARVVVPGQGAMPDCMRELDSRGLREAVIHAAASKPFLGICVGLQMLFGLAEEGNTHGLGILSGRVPRFPSGMTAPDGSLLSTAHGVERSSTDQRACLMARLARRHAFLLRAQLLRCSRSGLSWRWFDELRHRFCERRSP